MLHICAILHGQIQAMGQEEILQAVKRQYLFRALVVSQINN